MKVSALAVLSASAVFAKANAGVCDDLFGEAEHCEDWTESTCQQHIDEHGNEPPRCQPVADEDDGFRSMSACPEFCEMKPDDWSCSGFVTRGQRNSHFVPYGSSAGDTVFNANGKTLSKQNFGPIPLDIDFLGKQYKYFFISGHGFIRLATTSTQKPGDYYNYYKTLEKEKNYSNNRAMISPYWGDFDLRKSGEMSYRLMQDSEIPDMWNKYGYPQMPVDKVLVVTWSKLKFTTYSYNVNMDYTQTFQAIVCIMADGNVGISYNFGDIEQDSYQYTGATECGENGKHHNVVGFVGKNGIWSHPYSKTDNADLVDDTSNCGVTGRWNSMIKNGQIDKDMMNNYTLKPTKPISISVSMATGSKGTKQFVTSANKNPELAFHGCHCAGLFGGDSFGGPDGVDNVDNLCKQWKAAKACLDKNYGACSIEPEDSYSVSANFDKCITTGSGCGAASCAVDKHYMAAINAMIGKGWVAKPGNEESCQPGMMEGYSDSCCGEAPFVKAYSMQAQVCVDGKITEMMMEGMMMDY